MKKISSSLIAVSCFASLAQAQQSVDLDKVVVTATRTAQTADETLASVSVITREEIERSQFTSVAELLRSTPGITLTNSGGIGKSTGVFLRGTSTKDLLVLVDGVRVGSATLGQVSFEELNLSQVERIEVVRGPRSSLYGSDAAGGVIQIFTRRGGGKLTPSFSVSTGSKRTSSGEFNLAGGSERQWFNAGISGITTDGFDARTTGSDDKDGYHSQSVNLRAGTKIGDSHELEGFFTNTDSENEFDGFQDRTDSLTQVLGVRSRSDLSENWTLHASAGRSWDHTKSFSGSAFSSRFETVRDSVSIQNDFAVSDNSLLTAGVDYQKDSIESSNNYAVDSRVNNAVFAQYLLSLGQADMQFNLRNDDNEQFGNHTTGGVAFGYAFNDYLSLHTSYGTAFKAPSFNDLYYPFSGNPNLKPEESDSFEIGLKGQLNNLNWATTLYQTDFENMIAWAPTGPGGSWVPSNVNEARIRGLELAADYTLDAWVFSGNLFIP